MATGNQNWLHLFQELKKNDMLPVVFEFSKEDERLARQIQRKFRFKL